MGPEHASCNVRDGGRRRAAQLYGRPLTEPVPRAARPSTWRDVYPPTWPRDPNPGNLVTTWSRHWSGDAFDPRCPACRAAGAACADATPGNNERRHGGMSATKPLSPARALNGAGDSAAGELRALMRSRVAAKLDARAASESAPG